MDLKKIQETVETVLKRDKCLYPMAFVDTIENGNYTLDINDGYDNESNMLQFIAKTAQEWKKQKAYRAILIQETIAYIKPKDMSQYEVEQAQELGVLKKVLPQRLAYNILEMTAEKNHSILRFFSKKDDEIVFEEEESHDNVDLAAFTALQEALLPVQ
jgi:hypothetical protein